MEAFNCNSIPMCSIPVISEDEAREALLEYIGQRCCYGKRAAREFVFANINPSSAFHVRLVSRRHFAVRRNICVNSLSVLEILFQL